ncbi:hypothetical protein V493_00035 [Pseudogymnoascus sp. VKM F-4281 (FW-2241)]|nr:hypothetical protein V493_00035 [Pseudogymnoascus sp. VKM F-4281 (FW-2241)]
MKVISFSALLSLSVYTLSLAAPVSETKSIRDLEGLEGQLEIFQLFTSDTQNDVVDNKPCEAVTLIFARGTVESGNVGALVGPPFFAALALDIGPKKLAVQGVDYPADIPGFLIGGSPSGSSTMAKLIDRAVAQCPNTKLVLSGYSQGAQLVHNAAKKLSAATAAKITSIVFFGDPNEGDPVRGVSPSNVLTICHAKDNICEGGIMVSGEHLNYGVDAMAAATFVKGKVGL